jgi:hypothetical protein
MTFLAPPGFNLGNIVAAGKAGGLSLGAMNGAVGQYGSFDFQRSRSGGGTTYYPAYQVASNVAVGAYLNGTGIPETLSNAIEDTFALFQILKTLGTATKSWGKKLGGIRLLVTHQFRAMGLASEEVSALDSLSCEPCRNIFLSQERIAGVGDPRGSWTQSRNSGCGNGLGSGRSPHIAALLDR